MTPEISETPTPNGLTATEVYSVVRPSVVHIAVSEPLEIGPGVNPSGANMVATGIVLDINGHILTSNHLVENAETIIVTLHGGQSFFAELIGGDVQTDTAVVRISSEGVELRPSMFGDSSELVVGQSVLTIGYALALPGEPIITNGIVSATGVSAPASPQLTFVDMVLHTAPINDGNSGGPLLNDQGEVIGVNTAVIVETRGIGFAVNINDARVVARQLVEFGEVRRGSLGITPLNVSAELIIQLGIALPYDVRTGVLLVDVLEGSPAFEAGMQPGDIIVSIDQETVTNSGQLSRFLLMHGPGTSVQITYYHGVERRTVDIKLGE